MKSSHEIHLEDGAVERADRLLARALPGLSRRTVQRLLDQGRITIDGRRVKKGEWLRGERVLAIAVAASDSAGLAPQAESPIAILFEDDDCVAVDKPAGMAGHALRAEERGTVANFLVGRFPECASAGDSPLEAGLVHRLDTETSGVLVAARSHDAWQRLRAQFRSRSIEKRYLAVVQGQVRAPGEIRRPIAGDPRNRRRVRVLREDDSTTKARPAITRYRPLASATEFTLLEVQIPTGVMHQIRAHLAAIRHPVAGDALYGGDCAGATRHLLHAARIAFDHPRDGRRIAIDSPLPADFMESCRRLGLAEFP